MKNYDYKGSHTHCWDNDKLPCGIPLEKHTQCCLCDAKLLSIDRMLLVTIRSMEERFKLVVAQARSFESNYYEDADFGKILDFIRSEIEMAEKATRVKCYRKIGNLIGEFGDKPEECLQILYTEVNGETKDHDY